MKKFLLIVLAVLACCVTALAEDWNITLKVLRGADLVSAVVGSSTASGEKIDLVEGDNQITIPSDNSLFIIPTNETDIVSFKDSDGDDVEKSYFGNYYDIYASSYGSPYSPYTLSVIPESEYRTKTVTVKMDDCSKVSIVRADGKEFKPEENTVSILYNPDEESKLTIKPRSWSDMLYKVSVGGKDVSKSGDRFYVELVDKTGDAPAYVDEIDVAANFPEGLKFKTVITLDGPSEMISYIRINDTDVSDLAACLTEDGFEASPGDKIAIGYHKDYKIEKVVDNGEDKNVYSQFTIDGIDCDHNISIKGHKYAIFNVVFNVSGPEGIVTNTERVFVEGSNTVKISEKNTSITFSAAPGYYYETFTDGTTDYLSLSDWTVYGRIYLDVKEGAEYTIVTKKIRRDNELVVFFDDFSDISFYNFKTNFKNYTELPDQMVAGYNTVNFRDEDGYFTVYASGSYDGFYAYKNGELLTLTYESAKFFEDADVKHGDVYKVFFRNNPTAHTVTFNAAPGLLDGYDVKKDLIADADITAPVAAVGKTRFTISPKARATEGDLVVKVGDKTVEPVNGVYTFETEGDTEVAVSSPTSGIENVLVGESAATDVYNLQGICVVRGASAADVEALPAGIYIVGGQKVRVK